MGRVMVDEDIKRFSPQIQFIPSEYISEGG